MSAIEPECSKIMIELYRIPGFCIMAFSAGGFSVLIKLIKMIIIMTGSTILRQTGEFLYSCSRSFLFKMAGAAILGYMSSCEAERCF
jgi:hypothetical protein